MQSAGCCMRVTVYERSGEVVSFVGVSWPELPKHSMERVLGDAKRYWGTDSSAVRGCNDNQLSRFFCVTEVSKYRSIKVVWFSKSYRRLFRISRRFPGTYAESVGYDIGVIDGLTLHSVRPSERVCSRIRIRLFVCVHRMTLCAQDAHIGALR